MKKFAGLALKFDAEDLDVEMKLDNSSNIGYGDKYSKSLLWLKSQLLGKVSLNPTLETMLYAWLQVEDSAYLSFSSNPNGQVVIMKLYSNE